MTNFIKNIKKELTLTELLEVLKEENTFIRRIIQNEDYIIIETNSNFKGTSY